MRKKTILFDLDETLIQTTVRQYSVICDFLNQKKIKNNLQYIDYYTKRKELQITNFAFYKTQLNSSKFDIEFNNYFKENIESTLNLEKDKLIVDLPKLIQFKKITNSNFILLSLRNNEKNSQIQIEKLGLKNIFNQIYFLKHSTDKNPKIEIINQLINEYDIKYFIGDSITDFEAAKQTNIKFIKVKTGLFNFEFKGEEYTDINQFLYS